MILHITQVNEAEQFARGYLAGSVGSRVCWPQLEARLFKALQQRYSLRGSREGLPRGGIPFSVDPALEQQQRCE